MKNYWAEYVAYVKDNPDHKWFKRKLYGWGWTPVTWQGWIVTVVILILIFANLMSLHSGFHFIDNLLIGSIVPTLVLLKILVVICIWKGEKPKWQWGSPVRGTGEDLQR